MSRVCQLTGKKPFFGNSVSHSHRKTRKKYLINLIVKKILNPLTGKLEKMRISTNALRTLTKRMGQIDSSK